MNWINFFDAIYLINLPIRQDRLIEFTEEAEKYNIPFTLINGITSKAGGADGLLQTVKGIFENSIEKNMQNILIFEDDCLFLQDPNPIMNEVVKEIPEDYHICFLGCQATTGFHYRQSVHLLQLDGAFSTHAAFYSRQAIKEILIRNFYAPIDNFYAAEIQKMQKCYAVNPILATQREGQSNIYDGIINWRPFIEQRFNQKLAEL